MTSGSTDVNILRVTGEMNWRTSQQRFSTDVAVNRAKEQGLETGPDATTSSSSTG
jgi:hypothetical protein